MLHHYTSIVLSLIAALAACTALQEKSPDDKPAQKPTPAKVANPMAPFARLVSGDWKLTAPGMMGLMFDTWHWGPGRHSIRAVTNGVGADGAPWRAMRCFFWHPDRRQVCLWGVSTFARGVSEGTIKFEGDTADGVYDLYQTGGRRRMGLRWTFAGPDKYRDVLLEATGPEGLKWMNEWDHIRSKGAAAPRPPAAAEAPKPSEHLKAFKSLLHHAWEAKGDAKGDWVGSAGGTFHIQTTFEWVPHADAIYARTIALTKVGDGNPTHLLDAYFYHHTGTNALRCLALSNLGGVYEGDVTVLKAGSLRLDLKGYEGDRVVSHVVRFDFEKDGTMRHRDWSHKGTERTLVLDVHHKKLEPKKAKPARSGAPNAD